MTPGASLALKSLRSPVVWNSLALGGFDAPCIKSIEVQKQERLPGTFREMSTGNLRGFVFL
jgi:hypothetical protein